MLHHMSILTTPGENERIIAVVKVQLCDKIVLVFSCLIKLNSLVTEFIEWEFCLFDITAQMVGKIDIVLLPWLELLNPLNILQSLNCDLFYLLV